MEDLGSKAGVVKTDKENFAQGVASTFSVLVIWMFVVTFCFQNFVIPSSSMASTLLVGDHVLVDHVSLAPPAGWAHMVPYSEVRRGDVVVFYKPTTELNGEHLVLVKRVIGIPGDRVHLRSGIVFLNGVAQDEPQAAKPTSANYDPYRDDFPSVPPSQRLGVTAAWSNDLPTHVEGEDLVVPPESYFVMGDNRTNSTDGRFWGFLPRSNLLGRPLFVYWSFATPEGQIDKTTLSEETAFAVHEAIHFFDETRWRRTLHVVR